MPLGACGGSGGALKCIGHLSVANNFSVALFLRTGTSWAGCCLMSYKNPQRAPLLGTDRLRQASALFYVRRPHDPAEGR